MGKHFKVNFIRKDGFSNTNEKDHLQGLIDTNQYVFWAKPDDGYFRSFQKIKKGDYLHIWKPKTDKDCIYYIGRVLTDLKHNEEKSFSKSRFKWDWDKINLIEEHNGKQEYQYIVEWKKQPFPQGELYEIILQAVTRNSVKEIQANICGMCNNVCKVVFYTCCNNYCCNKCYDKTQWNSILLKNGCPFCYE